MHQLLFYQFFFFKGIQDCQTGICRLLIFQRVEIYVRICWNVNDHDCPVILPPVNRENVYVFFLQFFQNEVMNFLNLKILLMDSSTGWYAIIIGSKNSKTLTFFFEYFQKIKNCLVIKPIRSSVEAVDWLHQLVVKHRLIEGWIYHFFSSEMSGPFSLGLPLALILSGNFKPVISIEDLYNI